MILQALRTQTRDYHVRLETRLNILDVLSTGAGYRSLLQRFYGFYEPFEDILTRHWDGDLAGCDYSPRLKAPLLRCDLTNLGMEPREVMTLPYPCRMPAVGDFATALGSAYVLEGATLGGQIISKHLACHLGIGRENGGAFFRSYGDHIGQMWREFGEVITAYSTAHPQEDPTMIAAACETFACLEEWLCGREMRAD